MEKLKKKSQIGLDLSVCRFGIGKEISLSITLEAILAYLNCLLGERVKKCNFIHAKIDECVLIDDGMFLC